MPTELRKKISELDNGQNTDLDANADFAADVGALRKTRRFTFAQLSERLTQWGVLAELLDEIKSLSRIMRGYYSETDPATIDPAIRPGLLWIHGTGNDIPSDFPLACDTWDGEAWQTGAEYTPTSMDLIADLNNETGYYWFGGKWIHDDVNADGVTIEVDAAGKLRIKDGGVTLVKIESQIAGKITNALQRTGDTMTGPLAVLEPQGDNEPVRKIDIEDAHFAHKYRDGGLAGTVSGTESGNTITFAKNWTDLFSTRIRIARNFHIAGNVGETNGNLDVFDEQDNYIASLGGFSFLDEEDTFVRCGTDIPGAAVGGAQALVLKFAGGVLGAATPDDYEAVEIYEAELKDLSDEHDRAHAEEAGLAAGLAQETTRAQEEEQGRISKGIFADTNAALVADLAVTPDEGGLANISKTLKNVESGENFTINVHIRSEDGTIESEFSKQDEHNYTLNLEAAKPQETAEAALAAAGAESDRAQETEQSLTEADEAETERATNRENEIETKLTQEAARAMTEEQSLAASIQTLQTGIDRGSVDNAFTSSGTVYSADAVAVNEPGIGYALGDILYITGIAGGRVPVLKVTGVDEGAVTAVDIISIGGAETDFAGTGLTVATNNAGTGATVDAETAETPKTTLASVDNPIPHCFVMVIADETHNGETWKYGYSDLDGDGDYNWVPVAKMDGVPRDFVAEPVGAQEIEAGAVTDTAIGNRTINIDGGDGDIPVTGTLTSLLSGIASRLKAFRERLVTSIRPVSTALDTVFPSEKAVSGALADEAAARNMEIGAETARATAAENALASGKQNALNRTVQANLASTAAATDTGGNIAPGVAGVLPMANGGTGADTLLGTGGVASKIFPVSMTQADSPILACINSNYAKVGYIQSAEICKAFISQYCYWS